MGNQEYVTTEGTSCPSGYKQTEVGQIPEDWVIGPLETFTSFISYGFTNPMPTVSSGIYMITARDINNGGILFDTARRTSVDAYNKLLTPKSKPKKNDVLLTKDGTLGRLALVSDETICINQSVALLRPNNKAVPLFLKLLLESPSYQAKMLEDAGGSTIKHIYIRRTNRHRQCLKRCRCLDSIPHPSHRQKTPDQTRRHANPAQSL